MRDQWAEDTCPMVTSQAWLSDILVRKQSHPARDASVIDVSYTAADAKFAAAMAAAYIQAYLDHGRASH